MNTQKKARLFKPGVVFQLIVVVIVIPFLPLLLSWRWNWWEAWVYGLLTTLGFVGSRLLVNQRHPDLLAERANSLQKGNIETWDQILAPLLGLGGGLIPLIAGLDMRFGWSPTFNVSVKILALLIIIVGYAIGTYAMLENRFFSGVVRIQQERGHHVVSDGPYRWMRHPGYAGALLLYVATPFFLDSFWAFFGTIFVTVVIVLRTRLEDQTLQEKLVGYREYATEVPYRLVPGVW
ncbi:MAG: isoprenylcysteine carboxylmethyltransferase family protein [Ardenticatenaceae bacterium]|nr:isoprenylcysteine carboxylmethyltransferase family protein [Ardenticatenaceae bacterium]